MADFALKTVAVFASAGTMAAATAAAPNPMAAAKAKLEIAGTAASNAGVFASLSSSSAAVALRSTSAYATAATYGARFVDAAGDAASAAGTWLGTKLGFLDELDDVDQIIPTWLFDDAVETTTTHWYDPAVDIGGGMASYVSSASSALYDEWVSTILL